MKIMVTGGAGFIGSALVRHLIQHTQDTVINVDCLTYAGNLQALSSVSQSARYFFEKVNICSKDEIHCLFRMYQPDAVMHLAAESHVDRSIQDSTGFIQTNIVGTHTLLEAARTYWQTLPDSRREGFRFLHISTDEVYGDLAPDVPTVTEQRDAGKFTENSPYAPSSPYSASKAASDHLVRAWFRTYGLPVLITNCSNNYGPWQHPEKLIPLTIANALSGKPLPIYGDGQQIRDWLYVDDHVKALCQVLKKAQPGDTYTIGGDQEKQNIDVVHQICAVLEECVPVKPPGVQHYKHLITQVPDRPGHDRRYAIDATRIRQTLGWIPEESFETGIRKTVEWMLNHAVLSPA